MTEPVPSPPDDSPPEADLLPESSLTAPRQIRSRLWVRVGEWAAQAVLIVFGVVVGLALNEWREGQAERARTDRVLAALADEIRENRDGVAETAAYYGEMAQAALRIEASRGSDAPLDLGSVEGYRGDTGPSLLRGAYDAAIATGALLNVEIGLATKLASVYSFQEAFAENLALNQLTQLPNPARAEIVKWRAGSIYQNGLTLTESYDEALDGLPAPTAP
ncbi:MAG: hypothetical protein AAGI52_01635 [Bacteroidota bacterium]